MPNDHTFSTAAFGRRLTGGPDYPEIDGRVEFFQTPFGCLVAATVTGLPHHEGPCQNHFFGFHIHRGGRCSGPAEDPFADTGPHLNPDQCWHPQHAGDLPPLMEEDGRAFMAVLAGQLNIGHVLGRTVVVHTDPDDFHSQPAGESGKKMACGVILPTRNLGYRMK